jgi:hypothetical protein
MWKAQKRKKKRDSWSEECCAAVRVRRTRQNANEPYSEPLHCNVYIEQHQYCACVYYVACFFCNNEDNILSFYTHTRVCGGDDANTRIGRRNFLRPAKKDVRRRRRVRREKRVVDGNRKNYR